jgi:enamine deaminase RidA (YjgF/YER057c/UK114 family)
MPDAPKLEEVYGRRMKRSLRKPIGPYSHAIRARNLAKGGLLFIAGQIALDKDDKVVGADDIVRQYEVILDQIAMILEDAGGSLDQVVKLVHYVAMDVSSSRYLEEIYPRISDVRRRCFKTKKFPVSSMVGVTSLMRKGALIEVDAIAVLL